MQKVAFAYYRFCQVIDFYTMRLYHECRAEKVESTFDQVWEEIIPEPHKSDHERRKNLEKLMIYFTTLIMFYNAGDINSCGNGEFASLPLHE